MSEPEDTLFRRAAIDHYLQGEKGGVALQVAPPWTWTLVGGLALLILSLLMLSILSKVEVMGYGRGVMRPTRGVSNVVVQIAGVVERADRRPGEPVKYGDVVVVLDSATLRGQRLEADRQLDALGTPFKEYIARLELLDEHKRTELQAKVDLLREHLRSQEDSLSFHEEKVKAHQRLEKEGLISTFQVGELRESRAQALRQVNAIRQSLATAVQELASHHSRVLEDRWHREQETRNAVIRREALEHALTQTRVRATEEGTLDAMLVKPGDVVQGGQVIGRILPKETVMEVVAFLPEKDRARVHPGDQAKLELDQFPFSEFGTLPGTVVRVAGEPASLPEIQQALGDTIRLEGPVYRVVLEVRDHPQSKIPGTSLRSGMQLRVRFSLRRQRPIALLLGPIRHWFAP